LKSAADFCQTERQFQHHYKTVACDVTVLDQSESSGEYGGFLKQTSVNSCDTKKPQQKWLVRVKYCDLLNQVRAKRDQDPRIR